MNELTRLAEWNVPRNEIDHLNHMSTLYYGRRAEQGCARVLEMVGAGPDELAAAGLFAATVDHHTHFRREQMVDAPLRLSGAVITASDERIDVYEEMANAAVGELAAMFRLGVQLQDRLTREPARIPEPWLQAARSRLVTAPPGSEPRSLTLERLRVDLTAADFARAGIASHLRREIRAEACDADGFLAPPPPPRLADKPKKGHGVLDDIWTVVPGYVWPALEMRTLTLRTLRCGDVLDSYTALLSVSDKIMHWGTWVFDAHTGALVSVLQNVNIFFSFSTRRPETLPADVQAWMSGLTRPELLAPHVQSRPAPVTA